MYLHLGKVRQVETGVSFDVENQKYKMVHFKPEKNKLFHHHFE
jgi:hypothetical protein